MNHNKATAIAAVVMLAVLAAGGGGCLMSADVMAVNSGDPGIATTVSDLESRIEYYYTNTPYTHSGEVYHITTSVGTPVHPIGGISMDESDFIGFCNSRMGAIFFMVPGAVIEITNQDREGEWTYSGSMDGSGDVCILSYSNPDGLTLASGEITILVTDPIGDSYDNPIVGKIPNSLVFYDGAYIAVGTELTPTDTQDEIPRTNDPGLVFDKDEHVLSGIFTQPGTYKSLGVTLNIIQPVSDLEFLSDPSDGVISYA